MARTAKRSAPSCKFHQSSIHPKIKEETIAIPSIQIELDRDSRVLLSLWLLSFYLSSISFLHSPNYCSSHHYSSCSFYHGMRWLACRWPITSCIPHIHLDNVIVSVLRVHVSLCPLSLLPSKWTWPHHRTTFIESNRCSPKTGTSGAPHKARRVGVVGSTGGLSRLQCVQYGQPHRE